ncbi:copper resistance CopC family protein [Ruania halotolerans]|uniref:copper resistance CopC family protein n=1 Tax=Ruania halotolerans TaxID=2897773 RepID=UPI001E4C398F|nr:copper resistance CopC family protein [Ruania halotolerans]UFU07112.1 copper resistance protein CopC [Ruania halotolerans]
MSVHSGSRPGSSAPRRTLRAALTLSLAALSAGLLGTITASPAAAHSALISSDPEDGATLSTAPESLLLTFNEDILEMGTSIEITGPDSADVTDGEPELDGPDVRQRLVADLPAGEYVVIWRVVSADGHPIDGELTFTAEEGLGVTGSEGEAGGESEPTETSEAETANQEPSEEITESSDEDAASDSAEPSDTPADGMDTGTSDESEGDGPSAGRIALFAVIALGVIGAVAATVVRFRRNS